MEIRVRPLNAGETFCCSVACAKRKFKDTELFLNFSFLGRDYATFAQTKDAYYLKNKIKGRVVASLYAHSEKRDSILSFYVLKEKDITPKLKNHFEAVYLPKLMAFYRAQLSRKNGLSDQIRVILIELYEGQFFPHEYSMN